MSLEVGDQGGARWVKLLQLLGMDLTYDREERPWWSTATILGDTRRTALAVVDVANLGVTEQELVLIDLFEHATDSSWDGDIWIVAAGRLVLPELDPGWGPEFRASGWIGQHHGDLLGEDPGPTAPHVGVPASFTLSRHSSAHQTAATTPGRTSSRPISTNCAGHGKKPRSDRCTDASIGSKIRGGDDLR